MLFLLLVLAADAAAVIGFYRCLQTKGQVAAVVEIVFV